MTLDVCVCICLCDSLVRQHKEVKRGHLCHEADDTGVISLRTVGVLGEMQQSVTDWGQEFRITGKKARVTE